MKFVPNLRRVLLLNALGLGLILAIFAAVYYPSWQAGQRTGGKEPMAQEETWDRSFPPDFSKAGEPAGKFPTIMPLAVLGMVFLTSVGLMIFQFTEIPRHVEFTPAGVRLGRWLSRETFIPYPEILEVNERPQSRLFSAAICIRTREKHRLGYRVAVYAFPEAGEIYRQLQLRVAEAR